MEALSLSKIAQLGIPYESVKFSWQASDPDNDPLIYNFYLGQKIGEICQPELVASNLETNQYEINGLSPKTIYCWKVEACDTETCTSGPIWTFTTASIEPKPGPDLIISKLVTPTYWYSSWICRVNLIIKNQGEFDALESFKVRIEAHPVDAPTIVWKLDEKEVNSLLINERKLLRFRFRLPKGLTPGNYTLYVIIDADNEIIESNEENNLVKKQIIIR